MDYLENNEFVRYKVKGGQKDLRYFQILEREAFDYTTTTNSEFTAVATGANSGNIQVPNLEPDDDELYHILWGVQDGCTYFIRFEGTDILGVSEDTDAGSINNTKSPFFHKNPHYGFYSGIKSNFSIRAVNATGASLTPRVDFEGMKYRIIEITKGDGGEDDDKLYERLISGEVPSQKIQLGGFTR